MGDEYKVVWRDWPGRYHVEGCYVIDSDGRRAVFVCPSSAASACDLLNSGERKASHYGWESDVESADTAEPTCDCQSVCDTQENRVVRESVFRDPDWGLGMFDEDDVRVVVSGDRIFPMAGTRLMDFTGDGMGLAASEARAIAAMLIAAAKEVEDEQC